ncbi:uncharacterized protein LOC110242302 [Exaiptasia diaphana]|uniref:WAP domain-containing protein n=1 Tax=Exaiptasia diaphana TaxID=2652724 RepID=A0A913XG69_EXADI|nr:uncharacterized protein LOC110242302 [Exaiptasia diaphana]KXJ12337.1 Anosmin-1 [Exaiptasia diaphana]
MKLLVLLIGFTSVFIVDGLLDFNTNRTVVTPCGNVTNHEDNFGLMSYKKIQKKLVIRCAQGFTFASQAAIKCNVTSKTWIGLGKLSCKKGNLNSCPSISGVGACVESCQNDSSCNDKTKKCCSNGCGHTCVTSVAKGRCASKNKKYMQVMESSKCSSDDQLYWCAGYYANVTENCLGLLLRRMNDLINIMNKKDIAIMLRSPGFSKNLMSKMDIMNSKTIDLIASSLSTNQLKDVLDDLKIEVLLRIRNKLVQRSIIKMIMKIYGKDARAWPEEAVKNKEIILCWLHPKMIADLTKNVKWKTIIRSVVNPKIISCIAGNVQVRNRLVKVFNNDCSKWTADDLSKLNQFIVIVSPRCISKIPTQQICSVRAMLGQSSIFVHHIPLARKILGKMTKEGCSGKKFKDWSDLEKQSLNYLLVGAKEQFIGQLSIANKEIYFLMADLICRYVPRGVKMAMLRKLKEAKSPDKWTGDNLKYSWHCMDTKTLEQAKDGFKALLKDSSISEDDCQQAMALSSNNLLRLARKKAEEIIGEAKTWNSNVGCRRALRDYTTTLAEAFNRGSAGLKEYVNFQIKRLKQAARRAKRRRNRRRFFLALWKVGEANFNIFLSEINRNMVKNNNGIKLFIDLGLNVDSVDTEKLREARSQLEIDDSVARFVVSIYVKQKQSLNEDDLNAMGDNLCKGVTQKHIKDNLQDLGSVKKMLGCPGISEPMRAALREKFNKLKGTIDTETICTFGPSTAFLPVETLKKLPDDVGDGCSWIEQAGQADPRQLGRAALEALKTQALTKMPDEINRENIEKLGSLVMGFKKEDVSRVAKDAIPDAMKVFNRFGDGDGQVVKEFLKKLGKPDADAIQTIGKQFGKLSEDAIKEINKDDFCANREDLVKHNYSPEIRKAVKEKFQQCTSSRKRRNTDPSAMTSEQVLSQGTLLTADEIKKIKFSVYVEIAKEIGEREYGPDQKDVLEAWASVAKNGDASKMEASLIENLGAVCRGFSADDIGKMNFANDDAIGGCSQKGLSRDQINKGLKRIKEIKKKEISSMSREDLTALGYFAIGMTTGEIGSIPKAVYSDVYDAFNKLTGWDEAQLVKLKERLVEIKGPIASWDEADFTEANAAVGGFTESEIKSLSKESIQAIPVEGISSIPPSKMKYFSDEQLSFLSPQQSSGLTDEQKSQVPDYCKKMNMNCPKPSDSGGCQVAVGTVTILMVAVASLTSLF